MGTLEDIFNVTATTLTTCKQTSRGLRIWIEGDKLSAAGFPPATPYSVIYDSSENVIRIYFDNASKKRVTNGSRNGNPRPIIDLMNKKVGDVFTAGDALRVIFSPNSIEITRDPWSAYRGGR